MPICLPTIQPKGEYHYSHVNPATRSVLIKTPDTNLNMSDWGLFPMQRDGVEVVFVGMEFRLNSPFVYVGRYNGRCYLANGFHRTYGAAKAGATHVPCLFREAQTPAEIGIGSGIPLSRLEADNPPTVGHYVLDRAFPVQLRSLSRILHVSWSQYTMADE